MLVIFVLCPWSRETCWLWARSQLYKVPPSVPANRWLAWLSKPMVVTFEVWLGRIWPNRVRAWTYESRFWLGYLPNGDGSVVVARSQDLVVLEAQPCTSNVVLVRVGVGLLFDYYSEFSTAHLHFFSELFIL